MQVSNKYGPEQDLVSRALFREGNETFLPP